MSEDHDPTPDPTAGNDAAPETPTESPEIADDAETPVTPFMSNLDIEAIRDQTHRLGREIFTTLRDGFRSQGLTDEEKAIAGRAAEEIAVCHVLGIGAPQAIRERLEARAQRAQSTLIQLFAGEAVEAKAAVRDAILHVLQRVIRSVLGFLTKGVIA